MWPIWGPPGSCRPKVGPMLSPSTLLSGTIYRNSLLGLSSMCSMRPRCIESLKCLIMTFQPLNPKKRALPHLWSGNPRPRQSLRAKMSSLRSRSSPVLNQRYVNSTWLFVIVNYFISHLYVSPK